MTFLHILFSNKVEPGNFFCICKSGNNFLKLNNRIEKREGWECDFEK